MANSTRNELLPETYKENTQSEIKTIITIARDSVANDSTMNELDQPLNSIRVIINQDKRHEAKYNAKNEYLKQLYLRVNKKLEVK